MQYFFPSAPVNFRKKPNEYPGKKTFPVLSYSAKNIAIRVSSGFPPLLRQSEPGACMLGLSLSFKD